MAFNLSDWRKQLRQCLFDYYCGFISKNKGVANIPEVDLYLPQVSSSLFATLFWKLVKCKRFRGILL